MDDILKKIWLFLFWIRSLSLTQSVLGSVGLLLVLVSATHVFAIDKKVYIWGEQICGMGDDVTFYLFDLIELENSGDGRPNWLMITRPSSCKNSEKAEKEGYNSTKHGTNGSVFEDLYKPKPDSCFDVKPLTKMDGKAPYNHHKKILYLKHGATYELCFKSNNNDYSYVAYRADESESFGLEFNSLKRLFDILGPYGNKKYHVINKCGSDVADSQKIIRVKDPSGADTSNLQPGVYIKTGQKEGRVGEILLKKGKSEWVWLPVHADLSFSIKIAFWKPGDIQDDAFDLIRSEAYVPAEGFPDEPTEKNLENYFSNTQHFLSSQDLTSLHEKVFPGNGSEKLWKPVNRYQKKWFGSEKRENWSDGLEFGPKELSFPGMASGAPELVGDEYYPISLEWKKGSMEFVLCKQESPSFYRAERPVTVWQLFAMKETSDWQQGFDYLTNALKESVKNPDLIEIWKTIGMIPNQIVLFEFEDDQAISPKNAYKDLWYLNEIYNDLYVDTECSFKNEKYSYRSYLASQLLYYFEYRALCWLNHYCIKAESGRAKIIAYLTIKKNKTENDFNGLSEKAFFEEAFHEFYEGVIPKDRRAALLHMYEFKEDPPHPLDMPAVFLSPVYVKKLIKDAKLINTIEWDVGLPFNDMLKKKGASVDQISEWAMTVVKKANANAGGNELPKFKFWLTGRNKWNRHFKLSGPDDPPRIPAMGTASSPVTGFRLAIYKKEAIRDSDGQSVSPGLEVDLNEDKMKNLYRIVFGRNPTKEYGIPSGEKQMTEVEKCLGDSNYWKFQYMRGCIFACYLARDKEDKKVKMIADVLTDAEVADNLRLAFPDM